MTKGERLRTSAALVSPLVLILTLSTGAWSRWGWVTKEAYGQDVVKLVSSDTYEDYVRSAENNFTAQDALNREITGSLNEIKALLTIVPQLKGLIRNRCGGGKGLEATINDLKQRYRELTGSRYEEPACDSPDLLSN